MLECLEITTIRRENGGQKEYVILGLTAPTGRKLVSG
jgi:hypothetical protein